MADICVYYFSVRDRHSGRIGCSKRRATLEAIRALGEPVMESQMIVDTSEVDADGFLTGRTDATSYADEVWCEIRSLRLRARSRASEAKALGDCEFERRQLLCSESLELMRRANRLHQLIQLGTESLPGARMGG